MHLLIFKMELEEWEINIFKIQIRRWRSVILFYANWNLSLDFKYLKTAMENKISNSSFLKVLKTKLGEKV